MKASEVKAYTAILVALEGAAGSVRNMLREQGDQAVMSQALDELRKSEHAVAFKAMVRAAIAGAANAMNVDASAPAAPPAPPLPEGWPPGWTLMQDTSFDRVRYMPGRMVDDEAKPTALRYDSAEEARRDAWERYEKDRKG
ncbi:MAG TPA: hypothetical protein VIK91_28590 [Nannocystis sp.]